MRARIDGRIKEEAAVVLGAMGLTVSDASRLMMTRIAAEKALPFEPLVPNAETIEAMKAAAGEIGAACPLPRRCADGGRQPVGGRHSPSPPEFRSCAFRRLGRSSRLSYQA